MVRPRSSIGWRTVVSGGDVSSASRMSSKPTTAMSPGTVRPRSPIARMAPIAVRSEAAKTASIEGSASSSRRIAAAPPSTLKSPVATSPSSICRPAESRAARYPASRSRLATMSRGPVIVAIREASRAIRTLVAARPPAKLSEST